MTIFNEILDKIAYVLTDMTVVAAKDKPLIYADKHENAVKNSIKCLLLIRREGTLQLHIQSRSSSLYVISICQH